MLELRITVLSGKPAPETLRQYAPNGYSLYRDSATDLYFLTDAANDDFGRSGFYSDYHRVLNIPSHADWSYLKAFKASHNDVLKHTLIHDEIFIDALALSKVLTSRVLCVYSNDEGCDFAITAENGKLLRLRFKAGQKQGKRIDDDIAQQIKSDIQASRVLMHGEDPGPNEVFEYTAFEAIQTEHDPLTLHPYWTFREGEIDGQVIFDTVSSSPEGIKPNLLFRNAFLEFEKAFGQAPPDFTNIPDENRFQRVDSLAPPKISIFVKVLNFAKSLWALMTSSRKAMLWTLGIALVLLVAVFGDNNDRPSKQKTFAQFCTSSGGALSGEDEELCILGGKTYQNWNLPGAKGERRIMILNVGPQQVSCTGVAEQKCLVVDGQLFYDHIEGFTFRQGKPQVVPVERTQICDPKIANDCPQDVGIFRFEQILDLGK